MQRGILRVTFGLESVVEPALPPGHRIVATKPDWVNGVSEWLVEGPLLPDVSDGAAPADVEIWFTDLGDGKGTACWKHAKDQTWDVKTPSLPLFPTESW